jgi:molybdopterin-synthase adenylyltransferase
MAYQLSDVAGYDLSVAMSAETDRVLGPHLHKPNRQEDLAFAYWLPSVGQARYTAIISAVVLPNDGDRILQGNVAFLPEYLSRVLEGVPDGAGIAFMHGHLGPGWQGMSHDDVVAERDRLAGAVAGQTGLPLIGMTRGTDGAWSARMWARRAPRDYERLEARTVRVVGQSLRLTFHPDDVAPGPTAALGETINVWGAHAQSDLARVRVGIIGLGSVGSIAAEACSRLGLSRLTYVDHDIIEMRNLDRTLGATAADVIGGLTKVAVAARATAVSHTAADLDLRVVPRSVLDAGGLAAALDCDVLLSCVDRPLPRHLLNAIAFAHLIPVVDGGIYARVAADGTPLHVAWRIHTVGLEHACMVCVGALRPSDVALDREGKLDDPDYIAGLSEAEKAAVSRRNVFPFSLSVAAHQILQMVGLVTGFERVGGTGPQIYDAYPGEMAVLQAVCEEDCPYLALTATGVDLTSNLIRQRQGS